MVEGGPPADDRMRLALTFAQEAARTGWSAGTLRRVCAEHGVTAEQMQARWPAGVRTLGRELNLYADAAMRSRFERDGPRPLSEVLANRFRDNEPWKQAVARLAGSDLFHPFDTLARTARTAEQMWLCQDRPLPRGRLVLGLRTAALVLLYSACVLVWLAEDSEGGNGLRRTINFAAWAAGAR